MKQIKIFDTTLRDGEQSPGCSMNLNEKIEVARQLERLGVDVIEAGFAVSSPEDFESVRTIANTVKNCTVASLARCVKGDIDRAYEAVKDAVKPRIHVFLATSPIHMEFKLKMTSESVLARAAEMVAYAKSLCNDIEFSAEDASRSDKDFLVEIFNAVIKAGATVINIPDTVGYATPMEMYELISYVKERLVDAENVDISVHCHDDLGMSVACSLMAIKAGATQIECTVNGIGERAGNAAMEEIVMGLITKSAYFDACCNVNSKQIYRASKLISTITGVPVPPNKAIIGANAFAHESGIHQHGVLANPLTYEIMSPELVGIPQNKMVLGKHSGKHAFEDRLISLGYKLTADEIANAFVNFKIVADRKKVVSDNDIIALLDNAVMADTEKIQYVSYVINSGTAFTATGTVKLLIDDVETEKVETGDGPIDACFKAIERIIKKEYVLANYIIQSVSEGEDALGEVIVKIQSNNDLITGRGLSTDIIEASIKAYLNAVNKLI